MSKLPKQGQTPTTPQQISQTQQAVTVKDLKDLQMTFLQALKEQGEKLKEQIEGVKAYIDQRNNEIREDIVEAIEGLTEHVIRVDELAIEMEKRVENLEEQREDLDKKMLQVESDMMMVQFREMEYAIRITGFREGREDRQENLKKVVVDALGDLMSWDRVLLAEEVDRVFRVNSWIARQRQLPRDVVVYFTKKSVRNQVVQESFKQKVKIAGQEVLSLKEIPLKILRKRKEYAFLVEVLKKRQIQFRWEVPEGVVINHLGERHRINTVWRAKDFYVHVLKAGVPPSPERARRREQASQQQDQQLQVESLQALADKELLQCGEGQQAALMVEDDPKEQRMTRAATKKKEEEEKLQRMKRVQDNGKSEAVGGARPKIRSDMDGRLQKLRVLRDAT